MKSKEWLIWILFWENMGEVGKRLRSIMLKFCVDEEKKMALPPSSPT